MTLKNCAQTTSGEKRQPTGKVSPHTAHCGSPPNLRARAQTVRQALGIDAGKMGADHFEQAAPPPVWLTELLLCSSLAPATPDGTFAILLNQD